VAVIGARGGDDTDAATAAPWFVQGDFVHRKRFFEDWVTGKV
jgi:hypothetical protein